MRHDAERTHQRLEGFSGRLRASKGVAEQAVVQVEALEVIALNSASALHKQRDRFADGDSQLSLHERICLWQLITELAQVAPIEHRDDTTAISWHVASTFVSLDQRIRVLILCAEVDRDPTAHGGDCAVVVHDHAISADDLGDRHDAAGGRFTEVNGKAPVVLVRSLRLATSARPTADALAVRHFFERTTPDDLARELVLRPKAVLDGRTLGRCLQRGILQSRALNVVAAEQRREEVRLIDVCADSAADEPADGSKRNVPSYSEYK